MTTALSGHTAVLFVIAGLAIVIAVKMAKALVRWTLIILAVLVISGVHLSGGKAHSLLGTTANVAWGSVWRANSLGIPRTMGQVHYTANLVTSTAAKALGVSAQLTAVDSTHFQIHANSGTACLMYDVATKLWSEVSGACR